MQQQGQPKLLPGNIPQLTQALNGQLLPRITKSGPGFKLVPVPPVLLEALVRHYNEHRVAGSVLETTNGNGMKGEPAVR